VQPWSGAGGWGHCKVSGSHVDPVGSGLSQLPWAGVCESPLRSLAAPLPPSPLPRSPGRGPSARESCVLRCGAGPSLHPISRNPAEVATKAFSVG